MSYQIDPTDGDIIIGGFQNGIGDNPYSGLTDMRSIEPTSISGEASVGFSTAPVFKTPRISNGLGNLITTSSGLFTYPFTSLLEQGQAITFSSLGGATGVGLAINTPYFLVFFGTNEWQLYTVANVLVTVTNPSTTNGAIFSTIDPSLPTYIVSDGSKNWMLDSHGYLWSDTVVTQGGGPITSTSSWTWMKNTNLTAAAGQGLVALHTPNTGSSLGDTWIFIFRNQAIDYGKVNGSYPTWVYNWNPNAGDTSGSTQLQATIYHQAIVGPDGHMYFLNSSASGILTGSVGKVSINFQNGSYTAFNPASAPSVSNYSYTDYPLIPIGDTATCIAPSGTNMLIGGTQNYAYQWDTTSTLVTNYIYLAEKFVASIVTANPNSYIFCGNLGNIYVTNGSQADVWKKIPDHLSGTVYPTWKFLGATYQKGILYFGLQGTAQSGSSIATIGGVWGVDVNTKALRLASQLSYGTYAGYASCFLAGDTTTNSPPGTGIYIGWFDGVINYGVDVSTNVPYTGGQSYLISDLIPIGTAIQPTTPLQYEFKLSTPLLATELVELQAASYLGGPFTSLGITAGSASQVILSDIYPNTIDPAQWILIKVILTGKVSNPSFNRLTQIRIKGATVKDNVATAPFGLR